MDRLACISLPALPLQLALRRLPPDYRDPLVLIREDKPTSPILHLNRPARDLGIAVGMRYSQALSLAGTLAAALVSAKDLDEARTEVRQVLGRWSPLVEDCAFDPSCFWVGAGGLSGLYGTEAQWGASVRQALAERRYRSVVVVGLTRGGTYVLARGRRRSAVVRSSQAEDRALAQAPLSLFPLGPRDRRRLERLGLTTLAQVLALPAESLARRFGPELGRNLRQLEALVRVPLQPEAPTPVVSRSRRLDPPVADRRALGDLLTGPLAEGLAQLTKQGRLLDELRLVFVLEGGSLVSEILRPARPTSELRTLTRLLDLRMERCLLPSPVSEIRMAFLDAPLPPWSGDLFALEAARDLGLGSEALALIRARWGNGSVVRAVLADSHVPELSYRWEPLEGLVAPRAQASAVAGSALSAVRRVRWEGPFAGNPSGRRLGVPLRLRLVSVPGPLEREYRFLEGARGEVAWVSLDGQDGHPRWEGLVD